MESVPARRAGTISVGFKRIAGACSPSDLMKAAGIIDWPNEMRNLHELKLKTQK